MPNFDGGHYFLSTVAPIRVDPPDDGDPGSYVERVRLAIDALPRARQSPVTERFAEENGVSPFARNARTHFCRLVVIDDIVYNGRDGANPLVLTVQGETPLTPQHVDRLPCPYLMFVADFDAVVTPGDRLKDTMAPDQQDAMRDAYLRAMWEESSEELMGIYRNCQEFDGDRIKTPQDFADYLAKCQIETWMSFHDYYLSMPKVPTLPGMIGFIAAPVLLLLATVILTLGWIFGTGSVLGVPATFLSALICAVLTAVAGVAAYRAIVRTGLKPWPAPEGGSLPQVLKGLYVQQKFSDFALANQGASDKELFDAFGDFVDAHKPGEVSGPTQKPGVVKS